MNHKDKLYLIDISAIAHNHFRINKMITYYDSDRHFRITQLIIKLLLKKSFDMTTNRSNNYDYLQLTMPLRDMFGITNTYDYLPKYDILIKDVKTFVKWYNKF